MFTCVLDTVCVRANALKRSKSVKKIVGAGGGGGLLEAAEATPAAATAARALGSIRQENMAAHKKMRIGFLSFFYFLNLVSLVMVCSR